MASTERRLMQKEMYAKVQRAVNDGTIKANDWLKMFLEQAKVIVTKGYYLSDKQLDILQRYINEINTIQELEELVNNPSIKIDVPTLNVPPITDEDEFSPNNIDTEFAQQAEELLTDAEKIILRAQLMMSNKDKN